MSVEDPRSEAGPFSLRADIRGPIRRRAFELLRPSLERLSGLAELERVYRPRPSNGSPLEILRWFVETFEVRVEVDDDDLARLPTNGPAIVVANHPFGAIEGIVLALVLGSRRSDVKIMANYLLGRLSELRDLFILVDPYETREAPRKNFAPMRRSVDWIERGGMLATFPAGEVARWSPRHRRIQDPPWSPVIARIARRTRCPVIPVYFSGRNAFPLQVLGLLHPRLRTALLPRALLARRRHAVELRIGTPLPYQQLETHGSDARIIEYLRVRTEILAARSTQHPEPVQPRHTPGQLRPVGSPPRGRSMAEEVARLRPHRLLVENGDQEVFIAEADQIPHVLRQIGRLREITFREAGEGTGRELDLDEFDATYRHLFVWSRGEDDVVGAYRLGRTDELLRDRGLRGLYTSSLFGFKPRLFEAMGPALELGRSFVRPEHQKSYAALMMLWKGIGRVVLRDPSYTTLFGPVSISAEYQSASQRLIVAFLEQNNFSHEWARWVRPRTPCRSTRGKRHGPDPGRIRTLEDVSSFISEIEADHKGVPILLKQYLKLGGRLLGFNVDPDFSNVLDVLIMVDLRQTKSRILARYMGREGAQAFLAGHRDARAS